jgi:DNA-binding winged helix-turn-helix (wHTH) protein
MDPAREKRRYLFGEFTLSVARRVLLRSGQELPLIPRYFDLLVLLIERRNEAVHRREILDRVWNDVIVSDGALSQAVRILRRTLGDDSREPLFVRTIPRHGYRFVYPDVIEETDEGPLRPSETPPAPATVPGPRAPAASDPFEAPLAALLEPALAQDDENRRRQAAETLHALGTAETLRRLDRRPGHGRARAYLRDARWDVPGAGLVPLLGRPGGFGAVGILVGLRSRRALRLAGQRWLAAAGGGALAGALAGLLGGLVLRFGPGSGANQSVLLALPLVGLIVGGLGATGVGAGLAAAEAVFRAWRRTSLALGGALGGGVIGAVAHLVGRWTLEGLFGQDLSPLAGGVEGLVIGAAAGTGYGLATPTAEGGMATPRGTQRLLVAVATGLACAAAAGLLGWSGSYLGAMSLDLMGQSFPGSQVGLEPLARLLGEPSPGPLTRIAISTFEGLMFGTGLAFGLTRRPTPSSSTAR